MDLETLAIFADIARRGSFAATARERALEPSSLSRAIAALESQLGFRLLQRSTRKVALTEAGAIFLERVDVLLAGFDAAREEARATVDGPSGVLRLTASTTLGARKIAPLVPDFRAAYPNIRLELIFTDEALDLIGERIDLAIRLAPSYRGDVVGVRAFDTRYRVVAAPAYLASGPALNVPADIAGHRCALFSLPAYRTRWKFRDRRGMIEEFAVDGDVVISNVMALQDIALRGLGPALLPTWLIEKDLQTGALVDVFPDHEVAATEFDTAAWLLYPSRTLLAPKTRVAIDFFRARLKGAGA